MRAHKLSLKTIEKIRESNEVFWEVVLLQECRETVKQLSEILANCQKEIDLLNEKLDKYKDEEKPEPPHPQWEPAVGETYYTVNDLYDIVFCYKREEGSVVYDCQLSVGNVFRTQEEGEWALERLHVLTAMQRWAGEYGDPVSIAYYENDDTVQAISALYPNRGEMLFASYEDAENCIKEVGEDRIKEYYFCLTKDDEYEAESGV